MVVSQGNFMNLYGIVKSCISCFELTLHLMYDANVTLHVSDGLVDWTKCLGVCSKCCLEKVQGAIEFTTVSISLRQCTQRTSFPHFRALSSLSCNMLLKHWNHRSGIHWHLWHILG